MKISLFGKIANRPVFLLFLAALAVGMPAAGASGADSSPVAIAKRLQETYRKTVSMSADFRQVTSVRLSGREKLGSGTMVIQKPGRMRWDYLAPTPQVLVADGKTVSMYFAQSNQMIVTSAQEYLQSDVTYAFFTGTGDILRDFEVMAPEKTDGGEVLGADVIKLIPKETHPQVQDLHLWVDRKSSLIDRLQITDQFGSRTDLFFTNLKTNIELPASLFTFTPPPGTEIITQ